MMDIEDICVFLCGILYDGNGCANKDIMRSMSVDLGCRAEHCRVAGFSRYAEK